MTDEQKAALDLAILNLKTHGDDQLLSAVQPLIEFHESRVLAEGKQEPVNQCDGCRVRAPMNRPLMHTMPDGGFMVCTASRYLTHPTPDDARDAALYRWLRDTLHGAKAGGGIEVNERLQVYETPEPGEEVRLYWYQDTAVGFYEVKAESLDAAIDAAMQANKEKQ
jgi:hypothetical protein